MILAILRLKTRLPNLTKPALFLPISCVVTIVMMVGDTNRSRVYFPLRTGVELFSDPSLPDAVTRAKQAAVLYDELAFEEGMCEVTITQSGAVDEWIPTHDLTEEDLLHTRQVPQESDGLSVFVGSVLDLSDSSELFNGIVSRAYASEYHTGILDELAGYNVDWVKQVSGGALSTLYSEDAVERKLYNKSTSQDISDKSLMSNLRNDVFLRNWIVRSFNRDAVQSMRAGASFNTTTLFAPVFEHQGLVADLSGEEALGIHAPNLGSLSWEEIMSFRSHPGSVEARAMLREFEVKAAQEAPEDAQAFLRSVAQNMNAALFSVLSSKELSLEKKMAWETIKAGISSIPVIGQVSGPAITAAELAIEWKQRRTSWTGALMKLQK